MSRQTAMLCTEAVETVISNHYNDQLRDLLELKEQSSNDLDGSGSGLSKDEEDQVDKLIQVIKEFRDEEEEHKQIAIGSRDGGSPSLSDKILGTLIEGGCKVAIKVAKVI